MKTSFAMKHIYMHYNIRPFHIGATIHASSERFPFKKGLNKKPYTIILAYGSIDRQWIMRH